MKGNPVGGGGGPPPGPFLGGYGTPGGGGTPGGKGTPGNYFGGKGIPFG